MSGMTSRISTPWRTAPEETGTVTEETANAGGPTAVIRVKLDGKTSSASFEDRKACPTLWGFDVLQTLRLFAATDRLAFLREFLRDQLRGRYYPELDGRIYRIHLMERSTSLPSVLCGMVEKGLINMDEMRYAVSKACHSDLIPLQNMLKVMQKDRLPGETGRGPGTTLTVEVDLDREEVSVGWKGNRTRFTLREMTEKKHSELWERMEDLETWGREQVPER